MPADERPALTQTAPPTAATQPDRSPPPPPPAPPPAPPPTPTPTPTQTQTQTQTQTTMAGPECGAIGGLRLLLVGGEAGCDEVRRVAAGYDLAGAKVQEVAGWTCASATAQTRPVVFTCTRGGAEFVAREPAG